MKSLNRLISDYTDLLKRGELQLAYKGILDFLGKLRADFIKKYPWYDVSGIYQGYMDMSYFALSNEHFKKKGLKIAVVYLHDKGAFEVWLSARNREISKSLEPLVNGVIVDGLMVFHDETNLDAVIECSLSSAPDFDNQAALICEIEQGVESFVGAVERVVTSKPITLIGG
ncbi:MAG: hypothetical protein EOM51_06225 [Clostridia bacterium]|nr:hypothetical protein [Clostridia bacterium]